MADVSKKTADSAGKDLPVAVGPKRTGIVQFAREVYREGYQKVSWPSWKETYLTTIMVFLMVGVMMFLFFFIDWLLATGEGWILRLAG